MHSDIMAYWLREREKRDRLSKRVLFLDLEELLDPERAGNHTYWGSKAYDEGDTNIVVYKKHGREGLRRRYFRRRPKDPPEVQILCELARQYDRLMYPEDGGDPDIDSGIKLLAQLQKRVDAVEDQLAATYNQQIRLALEAAKIERDRQKRLPHEDAREVEVATPADLLKRMREDGFDEDAIKNIMGDEYDMAVAEVGEPD